MQEIVVPAHISFSKAEIVYRDISRSVDKASGTVKIVTDKSHMNTVSKALLRRLHKAYREKIKFDELTSKQIFYEKTEEEGENSGSGESFFEKLGGSLYFIRENFYIFTIIISDMLFYSIQAIWNRRYIIKYDTLKNIYEIGYRAVPLVSLLSFLIGLTITVQAAIQMVQFGGQTYLATLIGTVMLNELGPLLTAIIIAGRTGSSIAAEIGTMVVMEEVDALQTMGVKPFKFLLVPKFWAFTVAMPVLTVISIITGVSGGLAVSVFYNVPAISFVKQFLEGAELMDIFWASMKSLTFAWTILAIACYKGIHVRGGADAVGRATTESVVASIFSVIVIDAIYSFILYT